MTAVILTVVEPIICDGPAGLVTRMEIPPGGRTAPPIPQGGVPAAGHTLLPELPLATMPARGTLEALVTAARPDGDGNWILDLELGGEAVTARSTLRFANGTRLVLQMLSPGRALVAHAVPTRDGSTLLTQALRTALPAQLPLDEALGTLASLARSPVLPAVLTGKLHQLLARTPAPRDLGSGRGLRAAVTQSGSFLEARLHRLASRANDAPASRAHSPAGGSGSDAGERTEAIATGRTPVRAARELLGLLRQLIGATRGPAAPAEGTTTADPAIRTMLQTVLAGDLKARLFAVLAELGVSREDFAASASSDPRPYRFAGTGNPIYDPRGRVSGPTLPAAGVETDQNAVQAVRAATPRITDDVVAQTLRALYGALARMRLHQISTHPDHPHAGDELPLQVWSVELPVARHGAFDALELRIEDHGAREKAGGEAPRIWRVRLRLRLEGQETVHAQLELYGQRLAATLWISDPQTLGEARATLAELEKGLRAEGVDIARLDCREGAPPPTAAGTRLIDLSA